MTIRELVTTLLRLEMSEGEELQVFCQSSGCSSHAHPVESIELVDGEIVIKV